MLSKEHMIPPSNIDVNVTDGPSLFLFHLEAAVLNAYILYKLNYPTSKMTRAQFQKEMATSLMRNPAGSIRKRPYDFNNSNPLILLRSVSALNRV